MHIKDFRKIVKREQPCSSGLAWLDGWIAKHPDGNTTQFFRWAKSKAGIAASNKTYYDVNGRQSYNRAIDWLKWVFIWCLDWSEEKRKTSFGGDVVYAFCWKRLKTSFFTMTEDQVADALARAFEED